MLASNVALDEQSLAKGENVANCFDWKGEIDQAAALCVLAESSLNSPFLVLANFELAPVGRHSARNQSIARLAASEPASKQASKQATGQADW